MKRKHSLRGVLRYRGSRRIDKTRTHRARGLAIARRAQRRIKDGREVGA